MSLPEAAGSLLSALILTYNEEANIKRTLDHLRWLDSIVVIDSGSSDATLSILAEHAAVRVLHRPFDSFADQCNFGLDQITTPWVLSLDADYRIQPSLASEIQTAIRDPANTGVAGFAIPFLYCIGGRPLRSGMLPPRISLYRRGLGRELAQGQRAAVEEDERRLVVRVEGDRRSGCGHPQHAARISTRALRGSSQARQTHLHGEARGLGRRGRAPRAGSRQGGQREEAKDRRGPAAASPNGVY